MSDYLGRLMKNFSREVENDNNFQGWNFEMEAKAM
jgi:hypothetical protein